MKILVVSDSHGYDELVKGVMEEVGDFDYFIHCGDVEGGEDYFRAITDKPMTIVAGNNDFGCDLPREEIVEIAGYRILVTHGHYLYVNFGMEDFENYCRQKNVNVGMYGHTHIPYLSVKEDLTVLNPGSIAYPRQAGREKTYLTMEILDNGEVRYEHHIYRG